MALGCSTRTPLMLLTRSLLPGASTRAQTRATLRTLKQKKQESPQMFCERLITASEDAFDRTNRTPNGDLLPGIERILIDYFVDEISDNTIKMKLLRENPTTKSN